ncbi:MAG: hypothetical protein ACU85V_19515 [Gammaproteobacteria bacterium]
MLALGGCGAAPESPFSAITSPDGSYTLRVTVAEPRLGQGKHRVNLYLDGPGGVAASPLYSATLENDGVPFTTRNIAVRWVAAGEALVCLRATDLPDHGVRIDARAGSATPVDHC